MNTMHDRVAIITGAASGIGQAVAQSLADAGHRVVLADVDADQGAEVASAMGGQFVQADLTRRADCRRVVDETLAQQGRVDILVNNAGFQHVNGIEDFAEEIWEKMIALMLTAPFLLTKYCWPSMKANNWGRIVNIGSVHSLRASPFKVGYISAKHGMAGFNKTMALEGAPYGITSNLVCPAYVRTPLVEKQIADQARTRGISEAEVIEKVMLEPVAIKRLIEPEEIGALVLYLVSEHAGAASGTEWVIDMGWTAH
jgi:3-hydroxybutyrate dehydrogenase